MSLTVCKFGGTSLADAAQIRKVVEIVKADPARKFVVVSAPGKRYEGDPKVTDLLLALGARDDVPYLEKFAKIRDRFLTIIKELGLPDMLADYIEHAHNDASMGHNRDLLISRGEYICARIVANYLGFEFIDAAAFVRFSEDGLFDLEATERAWRNLHKPTADGYVIPGFYGMLPNGQVKTFSRGGSDFSGAVVAAVVEADLYENWTDVSGMMSADPRVVENPRVIREITYRELRELTYMGASVLHDEVVFPLKERGIPIHIKNTNAPEDEGTRIVPDHLATPKKNGAIVGIAGSKDFTVITLEKALMNQEQGFLLAVLKVFDKYRVSVEHMPGSIDAISVIIDSQELTDGKLDHICEDLRSVCMPDQLKVDRDVALICVVGHKMYHTPGIAADILVSLAMARVNTRIINQCVSELNIILGVDNDDYNAAVNAIYKRAVLKQ